LRYRRKDKYVPRKTLTSFVVARLSSIFSAIVLIAVAASCLAQAENTARPKVGLVLSGGGARGAAHVGVIKVLDEMHIPVDYIAGTSMGAIVGGLYASGLSGAELELIIQNADWPKLLSDEAPRAQRTYRRKADDFGFLVDFDVGVSKDGLIIPQGIVQGQNLTIALRRWLLPVATVTDFDRLPIPFRAVATDLLNGGEVVLKDGDLATAIRASMSVPGVFKPVRLDGKVLVDGGIADNLPVGVAKAMGAEVLIVVNVGSPLLEEADLDSPLKIANQMNTILITARTEEQKRLMAPEDVLITPELGRMSAQAFEQSVEAMQLGEMVARQSMSELQKLSLGQAEYAAHRQALLRARPGSPVIDQMSVHNESRLSANVLLARLADQRGAPLDAGQLEADISDIYGFNTFETVDYTISADGVENELLIQSKAKSWGPNFLRFGINLEDDFDGNSSYNLAARFTRTEVNAKGGEFRADVVVGESPQLAVEFYQPLDYRSRWFVNPRLGFLRTNEGLFEAGNQIAQFRSEEVGLSVGVGRLFSNWGELRLTVARSRGDEDVRIGDPALDGASGDVSNFTLGFGYDSLDSIAIPRSGTNLQVLWLGLREGYGADVTANIGQVVFLKPQTWGKNTVLHWWDLGTASVASDTTLNAFRLGGLFNLSGYAPDELQGDHRGIGRLLYYRRLGERPISILDTSVYLGASVEIGNVWQQRDEMRFSNTITAGSVSVFFDTLLGPLYIAYGAAEGGRRSAYLFLGQTF
jgi:NTE family protein